MSVALPGRREVNVVAVCYQRPADRFAASLQRIARRHGVALRGVLVCNRAEQIPASLRGLGFDAATGSNALLDFSGYFEGLERLLATRPDAAAGNVLFVNDTLFTKHAASCILGRVLGLDDLLRQLQVPAIAGKLDPYRSICRQNPWSGDHGFVTTFCYLVNARGLPMVQQLRSLAAEDDVFANAAVGDEAWGRRMPAALREHIRAHLAYEGSPYLWPAAGSTPAEHVRRKAACVYLESRLSGAIGREGALVPINAGPRASTAIFVREFMARLSRTTRAKAE